MLPCFECGLPSVLNHHVVPRSLGGTKTVPLCDACHMKIHGCGIRTSDLTRRAPAKRRSEGKRVGQVPYGMKKFGKQPLRPVPAEQRIIERIMLMRRVGVSYSGIALALNDDEIPSKTGGRWHPKVVRDIARRVAGEH